MSDEEMVAVNLGDDYYQGAYFNTYNGYPKDYLIPRSQLERWEGWLADYGQMQTEIEQVMDEQRERVREVVASRRGPKTPMEAVIEELYKPAIISALQAPATFRQVVDENDVPWLVTDSKIDREEEERGL